MKGISLNALPLASPSASRDGWTLDPDFLDEIYKEIHTFENQSVDLEDIEVILLALNRLDSRKRMEHNEKAV